MAISHAQPMLLLLLSLFFLPTLRAEPMRPIRFRDCGYESYPVKVTSVEIPEYNYRRTDVRFEISASTNKTINGERLLAIIMGRDGSPTTGESNLCDLTSCPVSLGAFKFGVSVLLDPDNSSNEYSGRLTIVNPTEVLMCIRVEFIISSSNALSAY
ncbi:unnamed protein product [Microthlaspi erraticum]|uniref:MD-2-related lipid-recognition domain-containing protein n=1 Tax=Microthlaspi erraticum TaxID=1685480 RepID=A0A6D2KKZ2_9BRAS|nr:unnamed protein product [Microthlaspi erraticum]